MNNWQDITTAPMAGQTLILGYYNELGKWRTVRGCYFTQERIDGEWEEPDMGKPGWYETAENAEDAPNCWAIDPTHWQPMPAPPKEKS